MDQSPNKHYERPVISLIYKGLPEHDVDLYVGGRQGASDLELLRTRQITTVLNTAVNIDFNYAMRNEEGPEGVVGYGHAPLRYYKLGIVDGSGNPQTMLLAGYYQLLGALDQTLPERDSYPRRERGNVLVSCRAGRSRSVFLAALFLHLRVPEEFPLLADAIAHVREKRALRPDEWHETPKQVLIDAAERAAEWVKLVEQDIAEKSPEIAAASAT
jgi:hypothetical protein